MPAQSLDGFLRGALGIALLLAGSATLLRLRRTEGSPVVRSAPRTPVTVALGFLTGVLVSVTSIGSGSLLLCVLALFFPLSAPTMVGTDLAHALLLSTVAALGHLAAGRVDFALAGGVLLGALPGVWLGARFATAVPERALRIGLAALLLLTGLEPLAHQRNWWPPGRGAGGEAVTNGEIAAAADRFEGRPPVEVLAWAAERFAGRVVFATGFGAEGCVLIDLVARHHLAIDLVTLDTGLLFDETYALWRRLEERYGVVIAGKPPRQTVYEQAQTHGDRLWERDPDRCCALAQGRAPRGGARGPGGLDHRHPPRPDPLARLGPRRRARPAPRPGQGQSALVLVRGRRGRLRADPRRPHEPAARARVSEHRLRAVHEPRGGR